MALSGKVTQIELMAGEAVRLETPGGGGYGPPEVRAASAAANDRLDGKVTKP